jgi:hypothetical protein
MLAPNLSATVLGLQALVATGRQSRCTAAMPFIERCQNYSPWAIDPFDDGGFFFAIDDPIRNKAGIAGVDSQGRSRFHSYGSATCDGLIALHACRLPDDHPRVLAVTSWMKKNVRGIEHAGAWSKSRHAARESLIFYYVQALAEALTVVQTAAPAWSAEKGEILAAKLTEHQGSNGSWRGQYPDSCEDDPILATAFAARALARIRAPGERLARR